MRAHLDRGPGRSAALLLTALLLAGCGKRGSGGDGGGGEGSPIDEAPGSGTAAGFHRFSSPIAISSSGKYLLSVNPEHDSVTIFDATRDALVKLAEIGVGGDPRSVALTSSGKKAWVANAISGTVSVIDVINKRLLRTVTVGTEPRGVALSPNGRFVYVANSVSNTVTVLNASNDAVITTVALPASIGTHPRALAVTNDGDGSDLDEKLYVACFFAERREGRTGLDEGQDDSREGRLAVLRTSDHSIIGTVRLGPIADTGFNSNGSVLDFVGTQNGAGGTNAPDPANPAQNTFATSAYPNQLASIAIQPRTGRAYVVSTGASPNGPFGFNFNAQGLVSAFETVTDQEILSGNVSNAVHQKAPLNLNQGLKQDTATQPVIFQSNPVAIAWKRDGSEAWIVVQNSNLLVRMTVDGNGIPSINAPLQAGGASITRIDLENPGGAFLSGKAPRGIVINKSGTRAWVHCFISRSVSVIDLPNRRVVGTALSTTLPSPGTAEATVQLGGELFYASRGPDERMSSEGWGSCIVCHPDGLTDTVTWMFPAGPRQSIALDGMFSRHNSIDARILNWSALRDENQDFELNTRGVFGGRGLIEDDRLLFVCGGASGAAPADSAAIQQFHQLLNTVGGTNTLAADAALPTLLGARRDFGLATLPDGRVFVIGGRSGPGQGSLITGATTVLEFDPRVNQVRVRSNTGFTARHSLMAAAVQTLQGPRLYAIGGFAGTAANTAASNLVQEYNPSNNTWRSVASVPAPVAEAGVAAAGPLNKGEPDPQIHVLGGNAGSEQTPVVTGGVLRYTPNPTGAGTWEVLPFTIAPRRNLGGAAIVRGVFPTHVFAVGGRDQAGVALTTVESYAATLSQAAPTPANQLVLVATPLTQLPAARHSFGTAIANNRIVVVGGVDAAGADVATIFEYNAAANPAGGTPGAPGTPAGVWAARASLPAGLRRLQVSSPPAVSNFLALASGNRDPRQDAITEWIQSRVRSFVAPNRGSTSAEVQEGRVLFGAEGLTGVPEASCATCHGGAKWSRSFVSYLAPPSPDQLHGEQEVIGAELRKTATQPGDKVLTGVLLDVGTFVPFTAGRNHESQFNPADVGVRANALGGNGFNIPSLLSVHATAPYLHGGLAATLDEVLNGAFDGNGAGPLRAVHRVASAADRARLIEFLKSIDETTPIFP